MLDYLLRRMLMVVPTLFGITIVIFIVICNMPGDPATLQAGDGANPEASERIVMELRERFHLDKPIHKRYFLWLNDLAFHEGGTSMVDGKPVMEKVGRTVWPTLKVSLTAIVLGFILSIPIGLYSAARQDGWFDRVTGVILYMLYSMPSYVAAILLILYFSVRWDLLPMGGEFSDDYIRLSSWGKFWDVAAHMTLYTVCVAYGSIAYYSRFVRQNLLEVIRQDYVRTARAKGLSERTVIVKHAFRNTLIPLITLLGLVVPFLLGGSVILEVIFNWPGMGRLFFTSLLQRDYPVIMALSTMTALLVLVCTLGADLLYGVVDPRVSHR